MAKPVKVKRYNNIYKGGGKGTSGKFWRKVITIIVFLIIVGFGYIFAAKYLRESKNSDTSILESSSTIESSVSEYQDSSEESNIITQNMDFKSITITTSELLNANSLNEFLSNAVADGYNSVVIPYKLEDGVIYYNTEVEEAVSWATVNNNTVDAEEISKTVKDAGLIPIASLSAFIDNTAAHASRDNAITYKGDTSTTWLGGSNANIRWLNPYKDIARKYICDLVSELRTIGYDNIMLNNVKFPDSENGKYDLFDNGVSKQDILKQFITELNETGANIILVYDWNEITDGDVEYGGDPSGYGAAYNAPIIDLSLYSNGLEYNGQTITNDDEIINILINQIISNSGSSSVTPVLTEYDEEIINALNNAGVLNYIIQ